MSRHRRGRLDIVVIVAISSALLAACDGADIDSQRYAVAVSGPWVIPAQTLAVGDTQSVPYTSAGPWVGKSGCGGGILAGAAELKTFLLAHYPQAYHIGGYSCRSINGDSSKMSVHATGRALDVMIKTIGGEADNTAGDPIGNWLIENAQDIGIQYIIWDRWTWMATRSPGSKHRKYGGAHPHHNHLHVELSVDGAAKKTPWFSGPRTPPPGAPTCEQLPENGGVIDNDDPCFAAYGDAKYWRTEQGHGINGSLLWTNAFESDAPGNWARWSIKPSVADRYRVEVYVAAPFAEHETTRYVIRHGGKETTRVVDLSALPTGWHSLGELHFDTAAAAQDVSVYDNESVAVGDDQHIVVDAIRLTRLSSDPADAGGDDLAPSADAGAADSGAASDITPLAPSAPPLAVTPDSQLSGGCSAARSPVDASAAWLLLALGLLMLARRCRASD